MAIAKVWRGTAILGPSMKYVEQTSGNTVDEVWFFKLGIFKWIYKIKDKMELN